MTLTPFSWNYINFSKHKDKRFHRGIGNGYKNKPTGIGKDHRVTYNFSKWENTILKHN